MNILAALDQMDIEKAAKHLFKNETRWMPAEQVANLLGVNMRRLRGEGSPIRSLVISSDLGYRSLEHATDEEWNTYCERIRSHAIEELRHVQHLKRRRLSDKQTTLLPIH